MGFFIWSIFINKLNVMSIEKIKERIKMIEGNNFEVVESSNKLTQTQASSFQSMDPKKASNLLKTIGKADNAYGKALDITRQHFDKVSRFNISDNEAIELPHQDIQWVKNIYKIFSDHNLLTGEINKNRFDPYYGYVLNNNIINTLKTGEVQLRYTNNSLSKLEEIQLFLSSRVTQNDQNYIDLVDELNNKGYNFNVGNINNRLYITITK